MKPSKQHDIFELSKDLNPIMKKGMLGVILAICDSGNYEVEFVRGDGTNYKYNGNYTFAVDSSYFEDVVTISLQPISSIYELHLKFMLELKFPGYYGMNWDAFWDTITSLTTMPGILKLAGWKKFSKQFPNDSAILRKIIEEFNEQFFEKKIIVDK